jgi:hypothetical protein
VLRLHRSLAPPIRCAGGKSRPVMNPAGRGARSGGVRRGEMLLAMAVRGPTRYRTASAVLLPHRGPFSLGRKPQDAACELVGPHFVIAVAFERQPSLIEGCFQDCERLGIKRSAAKSTHVPSLDRILLEVGPPEHHHDMADIMDAAALELHTSHAR